MEAMTRIRWEESMMTRCLSRLADAYPQTEMAEKQAPAKAAKSEFILDFEIPAADPAVYARLYKKPANGDDSKRK